MNAIAHASPAPAGPQLDNRRVLAGVVDLAIIVAGGFALGTVLAFATGGEAGLSRGMILAIAGWALFYHFAFESADSQSVGKKLMNLRVVRVDGAPPEMGDVARRTLLRVVDGPLVPLVGLIVMMVTGERRQRVGDLVAGTMVVDSSASQADVAPVAEAAPAEAEAPAEPAADEEPAHQGYAPPAPVEAEFDPYSLAQPEPETEALPPEPQPEPFAQEPVEEPAPFQEPVAEAPLSEEAPLEYSLAPEPVAEDAPLEYSLAPEPVVEEAPVEEPFAPEPVVEVTPAEEPFTPEPVAEEAPVEESFAPEPVVEVTPAEEPFTPEPVAEEPVADESFAFVPIAEEPPVGEPVAEEVFSPEPAADPQNAEPTPEESLAALMGEQPPGEEPAAVQPEPEPEPEEEETVTLRPMETMSAIDMVMGADEGRNESSEDEEGRDQPDPQ